MGLPHRFCTCPKPLLKDSEQRLRSIADLDEGRDIVGLGTD
jgi:hypothetical protein